MRFFAAIFVAAMTMTLPAMAQDLAAGSGQIERDEAAGATAERQRVFYHRPEAWAPSGRIVVVMHGVNRDADRYRDQWRALADQYGFLLIVPEFSPTKFPGDSWYNFGGMVDEQNRPRPRELWSFGVIDRVVAEVGALAGAERKRFSLYGHSAGAQFAHRFLLFAASTAVEMVVAANAGWYTLPVTDSNDCTGQASTTVTVNSLPSCSVTGPGAVCSGTAGTTYSGPGGMSAYSWSILGNGTISGPTDTQSVTART